MRTTGMCMGMGEVGEGEGKDMCEGTDRQKRQQLDPTKKHTIPRHEEQKFKQKINKHISTNTKKKDKQHGKTKTITKPNSQTPPKPE